MRYYFHIFDGAARVDNTGAVLPSLQAAKNEAVRTAGQIIKDAPAGAFWKGVPWRMQITDSPALGHGQTLFALDFAAWEPGLTERHGNSEVITRDTNSSSRPENDGHLVGGGDFAH